MKFLCLGYADMSKFAEMPEAELTAAMNECFDYDDVLRIQGHFVGGEALREPSQAVTLRYVDGRVQATDGPYAETKEQLGGILILAAENMAHAVELMSKHPGVRTGPFEIRPADDEIHALIAARDKRLQPKQLKANDSSIEFTLKVFNNHRMWWEQSVADIPDSRFAEQPNGVRNHPAWTLSHLNATIGFLLKLLDESDGASTDEEGKLFGYGSIPTTDRSHYPSKEDLLQTFRYRHERADAAVRSKHDEYFGRETPELLKAFAPTIGEIAFYLLATHESYHLGQLMQWRRAAGLLTQ